MLSRASFDDARWDAQRSALGIATYDLCETPCHKNYQDICVIAFPTPLGDDQPVLVPTGFDSNNNKGAWKKIFNPADDLNLSGKNSRGVMSNHNDRNVGKVNGDDTSVQVAFANSVTIGSLRIPSTAVFAPYSKLASDVSLVLDSAENGKPRRVATLKVPDGCSKPARKYGV